MWPEGAGSVITPPCAPSSSSWTLTCPPINPGASSSPRSVWTWPLPVCPLWCHSAFGMLVQPWTLLPLCFRHRSPTLLVTQEAPSSKCPSAGSESSPEACPKHRRPGNTGEQFEWQVRQSISIIKTLLEVPPKILLKSCMSCYLSFKFSLRLINENTTFRHSFYHHWYIFDIFCFVS